MRISASNEFIRQQNPVFVAASIIVALNNNLRASGVERHATTKALSRDTVIGCKDPSTTKGDRYQRIVSTDSDLARNSIFR